MPELALNTEVNGVFSLKAGVSPNQESLQANRQTLLTSYVSPAYAHGRLQKGAESNAREAGLRALERNGKAMIGNHLLNYREMKAHQESLLAEGQRNRLLRSAPAVRRRPVRSVAAGLGSRLEALGRRLQALDSKAVARF